MTPPMVAPRRRSPDGGWGGRESAYSLQCPLQESRGNRVAEPRQQVARREDHPVARVLAPGSALLKRMKGAHPRPGPTGTSSPPSSPPRR